MLIQFNFKNFKSFRDEASLDLSATRITEYPHHIIEIGNEKLLPVASLFGANASGKSNVIEAFRFMRNYIRFSFTFDDGDSGDSSRSFRLECKPFLFDPETRGEATSFEVYFVASKEKDYETYNYGFTIKEHKIEEEWLNHRDKSSTGAFKRVFYRSEEELDFSGLPKKQQENLKIALSRETLAASLGAKLQVEELKYIRDWFNDCKVADFGRPIENLLLSNKLPKNFVENQSVQKEVVDYFAAFDPAITGFEIEAVEDQDEQERSSFRVEAVHKMTNSNEMVSIPLQAESAGTLKMFALYPLLQEVFHSGGVLFVDELNARLHPLLVRTLLISFLDPAINPNHAQLIFTSHEPWHMSNRLLRRDEVWFVEKDADGASSLYSLADFIDEDGTKIRKDENYEKNYLLGKYGAIPVMNFFDMLRDE